MERQQTSNHVEHDPKYHDFNVVDMLVQANLFRKTQTSIPSYVVVDE